MGQEKIREVQEGGKVKRGRGGRRRKGCSFASVKSIRRNKGGGGGKLI